MKEIFATITVAIKVAEGEIITPQKILAQLNEDIIEDCVQIDTELNDDNGASFFMAEVYSEGH